MTAWRLTTGAGLILLVVLPLLFPVIGILNEQPLSLLAIDAGDLPRLAHLTWNTILLVAGTLALCLPAGILLAVLFFRTDLPLRRLFLGATVLLLFVPLPVQVSAWQSLLGHVRVWSTSEGRPWTAGMWPAIWVHGLAGLPWVVLIVGVGLSRVERELEEEALLSAGPWRVLRCVTLPRARGAIAVAGLWVALLTAGDISATDMFLVPTLAEEMQTQFTMGGPESVVRTVRLAWPVLLALFLVLIAVVPWLARAMPPLQNLPWTPLRFSLGKRRLFWAVFVCGLGVLFVVLPLGGLVWNLGLAGQPRSWSAEHAWQQLHGVMVLYGRKVLLNLAAALFTGWLTASAALVACWLARESRAWGWFLTAVIALAWTLPGPLAGVGLQGLIQALVEPGNLAWHTLYYQSSALPVIWVHVMRFLPFAVAILWPAVQLTPAELRDTARLEGASAGQELRHVYLPLTLPALFAAILAVTALSLGEVGAAARVDTPGWESFAKLIFDRMHYGVENNVAALCLLLLAAVTAGYGIGFLIWSIVRRG